MRRTVVVAFWVIGAVVWASVPAVGLWWFSERSMTTKFAPPEPTQVPVVTSNAATVLPVKLLVTRQPGLKINAPAWTGLVQHVDIAQGDTVTTGTAALKIDGVTRIFAHTFAPFWRPIASGMSGDDVQALNELLVALKLTAGSGRYASNATATGIKELAAQLGASTTTTFEPAWVIWLPEPMLQVGSISIAPNTPAPAAGTAILTSELQIAKASIVPAATTVDESTTGDNSATGINETGPGASGESSPPANSEDSATPTAATYQVPQGATVDINGVVIEVGGERDQVAATSYSALAPLVRQSRLLDARVTIPASPGQIAVPPAAIFTAASSASCVMRVRDSDRQAVVVEVLGGDYTHSFVTGDLREGDYVVIGLDSAARRCD